MKNVADVSIHTYNGILLSKKKKLPPATKRAQLEEIILNEINQIQIQILNVLPYMWKLK